MTRTEFDAWIEQHYGELVAVAKHHRAPDPEGAVATAYARAVDIPRQSKKRTDPLHLYFRADASGDGNPWGRMSKEVTGIARDQREVAANRWAGAAGHRAAVQAEYRNRYAGYGSTPIHGRKRPADRAE